MNVAISTETMRLLVPISLRLVLCWLWLLSPLMRPAQGAEQGFRLVIDGNGSVTALGKTMKMTTRTEIIYSWQVVEQARTLTLHSALIRMSIDGEERMNLLVEKNRVVATANGQPRAFERATAPPELRAKMDAMGTPLMVQTFDQNGHEIGRKLSDVPAARDFLSANVHLSGLLFHPLPPGGRQEFQGAAEMAISNGATLKGDLSYKRLPEGLGETYAVSGTLTKDSLQQSKMVELRNIRNTITGRETYDAGQKAWVSGTLNMETNFEMWGDGKPGGTSTMKATATLSRCPLPE